MPSMRSINCAIIGQESFKRAICEYLSVPNNLKSTLKVCDVPSWMFNDEGWQLSYLEADIFLLSYSVMDLSSFRNIRQLWMPAIRRLYPQVPVILVGIEAYSWDEKKRLMENNRVYNITYVQGWCMAYEIDAWAYKELTHLEDEDIEAVFELVIECVTKQRLKNKKIWRGCVPTGKCSIM